MSVECGELECSNMLLNVRKWDHVQDAMSWCLTVSSWEATGRCQQARAPQRVHRNATALTNLRGKWRILRLGRGFTEHQGSCDQPEAAVLAPGAHSSGFARKT